MNTKKLLNKSLSIFLCLCLILTGISAFTSSNDVAYAAENENDITINGYVDNILLPPSGSSTNAPDLTFNQNQTEYSIVLPDCRDNGISITVPESYALEKSLYYTIFVDGKAGTAYKNKQIKAKNTNVALAKTALRTNTCPIGKTTQVKVQVGTKNFVTSDIYTFNVTRSLTLDEITVIPCDGENDQIKVLEKFANQKDPYRTTYALSTQAEKVKLELSATTAGTEIYIGDSLYDSDTEYILSEFTQEINEQTYSVIPITLRYPAKDEQSVAVETEFKLVIGNTNNFPQIVKQPSSEVSSDKAAPVLLEIEAVAPNGGTLSYAWYKNGTLLSDDNAKANTYQPSVEYAGTNTYKCVIINTLDGINYKTESNDIEYTVNKDSLTAPEFTGQTPVQIYGGNGSNKQYENSNLNLDVRLISAKYNDDNTGYVEGVPYQLSVYRGTTLSFDDAELISNTEKYSYQEYQSGGDSYGKYKKYVLHLPSQKISGDYYYFVKVYVEEGEKQASRISTPIKITFTPTSEIVLLDGNGTEKSPYLVYSQNDLEHIKALVEGKDGNEPYNFSGQVVAFANNIILSADWEPIGNIKDGGDENDRGISLNTFSGTIDGKGYKLTVADHGMPLLKYARQTTVRNLTIKGEHIDSNGLVDKYVVDYGEDGVYVQDDVHLRTIDIENVRIESGTQILKSGFISGVGSGVNSINIRNCTVEEGVIIGYDKTQSYIGSFAGTLNGSIESSKSAATVYGVKAVGGLVGGKGQSMGRCDIKNSAFTGNVEASGNYAGGIIASGYDAGAPGTPVVQIHNCYVATNISGTEYVGGIIGADKGHETYNEAGDGYGIKGAIAITDTVYYGNLNSSGKYVGGIIGALHDFTKTTGEASNFYLDSCGAKSGIGGTTSGQCIGEEKHSSAATAEELASETILNKLNSSETSYKNWIQGEKYPIISAKVVVTGITVSGEYKTKYTIGDEFSLNGMVITANYSDGTKAQLTEAEVKKVEVTGYKADVHGTQTVTLKYGVAETSITVTVLKQDNPESPKTITISFTLLGDDIHDSDKDGKIHTLESANLQQWIKGSYEVSINATVKDVFEKALREKGYTWRNESGNYVQGITKYGSSNELAELTNGPNSGWMYTLNGMHPNLGVAEQYLENGDVIIFHYTDDYNYEPDTKNWISAPVEEVKDVTTDKTTGTTTSPTDVKVSEKTNADGTKESVATVTVSADNQKEILKQAKSNKSKEIILKVSKDAVKDATKADVQLDKSFIESVLKDTEAKLTVKTPFGDKTYTQDELKALVAAAAGKTVSLEIVKSEKPEDELKAELLEAAKATVAKASMKARSTKTSKGNVKIVFKPDTKTQNFINEMKDMGYIVKYRFYRSTKKSSGYKAMLTKTSKTYTNTSGKKGTKYYYKVQVRVYDENGKCVAKTALKQCKYASRTWTKK